MVELDCQWIETLPCSYLEDIVVGEEYGKESIIYVWYNPVLISECMLYTHW